MKEYDVRLRLYPRRIEEKIYTCIVLDRDQALRVFDDLRIFVENYKSFETETSELIKSVVFVEGSVSTYSLNEEEYINMKGSP